MIETRQQSDLETHYRTASVANDHTYKDAIQRFGPDAFKLEYNQFTLDASLRDDLIGYLGEYRLKLQKYNYTYFVTEQGLVYPNTGEPLDSIAKRAIVDRKKRGLPTEREEAELTALSAMRTGARFIQNGDTILWASPPGPKEQGYGDYGFLFVGNIAISEQGEKVAEMTAIRLENPTIVQYGNAMSQLTGIDMHFEDAIQFLQSPRLLGKSLSMEEIDSILSQTFSYATSFDSTMLDRFIRAHDEDIKTCLHIFRHGTKEEKLEAFHTIEHLAIVFRNSKKEPGMGSYGNRKPDFRILMKTYGYEPPEVGGSCGGSSTKKKSNNPLSNGYEDLFNTVFGDEEEDDFGSRTFVHEIEGCGYKNRRPYNEKIHLCQNPQCPDPKSVAC